MKSLLTFVIIISCSFFNPSKNYFFDFDEVIHYSNKADDLDTSKIKEQGQKNNATNNDKILYQLLFGIFPIDIKDKSTIPVLEKNFIKKNINKKFNTQLREEIFVEIKSKNVEVAKKACIARYNDIFVFKKNDVITGIAKICFHCRQYYFLRNKIINAELFGASREFEKLEVILKENNKK